MKQFKLEINTYYKDMEVPEHSLLITVGPKHQLLPLRLMMMKSFKKSGPKVPQGYTVKFEIREV